MLYIHLTNENAYYYIVLQGSKCYLYSNQYILNDIGK